MSTSTLTPRTSFTQSVPVSQRDHERLVVALVDRIERLEKEKQALECRMRDMDSRLSRHPTMA